MNKRVAICLTAALLLCSWGLNGCRPDSKRIGQKNHTSETGSDGDTIETLSDKDIYFRAEKDVPDTLEAFDELIDLCNSMAVMNAAYVDVENALLFGATGGVDTLLCLLDVSRQRIADGESRREMSRYVRRMRALMDRVNTAGEHNDTADAPLIHDAEAMIETELNNANTLYYQSLEYIVKRHAGILGVGKDAQKLFDKKRWVPQQDSIEKVMRGIDASYAKREKTVDSLTTWLREQLNHADDVAARHVYLIDYVHATLLDSANNVLSQDVYLIERYLEARQYSPFIAELWRTWRCLMQVQNGVAWDAVIPNRLYDEWRHTCLNIILRHLIDHPDDEAAIRQFVLLSMYRDIIRFCSEDGNSALVEAKALF